MLIKAVEQDRRELIRAIYTRKSTEQGLEQEVNTLEAQRETCSAYIRSQRHRGWTELEHRYDDGAGRMTALGQDLVGTASDLTATYGYNPASQIVSRSYSKDVYAWTGLYAPAARRRRCVPEQRRSPGTSARPPDGG